MREIKRPVSSDELIPLLEEIRNEVRAIRQAYVGKTAEELERDGRG